MDRPRIFALGVACASLLGVSACTTQIVVAPISINVRALGGGEMVLQTEVTRLDSNGVCEYRLEYLNPSDSARGINEISSDRVGPQRIRSCASTPPAFTATDASNASWFDDQSTYYWAKKSRDYADASIWVAPPGWTGGSITFGTAEVTLQVLTPGGDGYGFELACFPRAAIADGCMRYWPGRNPQIYIPMGRGLPDVVSHEFGHYAAGYAFGHMETLSSGGFKIDNCVHRAFQEGIAEIFKQLFYHHEETAAGATVSMATSMPTYNSQWVNECSDEYVMSAPLWQSFAQSAWGAGLDASGTVTVPWPNAAAANKGMADAFAYSLLITKDFRMHDFAVTALTYLDSTQPPAVAAAIRAIFGGHGMAPIASGRPCIENQECASNYCDNGDGTSHTRLCLPAGGTGLGGEACTNSNQCAANSCVGASQNGGNWTPGACTAQGGLGSACNSNNQCASTYCDGGVNTAQTNQCMPRGGAGLDNDPCTHNTQCASNNCAGLRQEANGNWTPGRCSAPVTARPLGMTCSASNQCASTYCDAGFNTANTNRCMPRGGAGQGNDPCTNHTQCASGACANLRQDGAGNWLLGTCVAQGGLGASCNVNSQCVSTYCDAGFNTAQTNKCMPRGGEGLNGDPCTNNRQCATSDCRNLRQVNGNWEPGSCR